MSRVTTNTTGLHSVVSFESYLFKYPYVYLCKPGYLSLNEKDTKNLREYLERGGFVMFDDFRGPRHLNNLLYQLKKVFPNREVVPLEIRHAMFNTFYQIDTLDVRAPYGPGPVEFLGMEDDHGRLMMVINYNNDLSEFWEWLDRGELPFRDAASSLKFGVT